MLRAIIQTRQIEWQVTGFPTPVWIINLDVSLCFSTLQKFNAFSCVILRNVAWFYFFKSSVSFFCAAGVPDSCTRNKSCFLNQNCCPIYELKCNNFVFRELAGILVWRMPILLAVAVIDCVLNPFEKCKWTVLNIWYFQTWISLLDGFGFNIYRTIK